MHPFRTAVERRDLEALLSVLADDVVFRSPVTFAPYHGKAVVGTLLSAVNNVFADFTYVREIGSPGDSDHGLVFTARVGDRQVEGCDFLHTNDEGLVDELVVMVRPLSGLLALAEAMKQQLLANAADAGA